MTAFSKGGGGLPPLPWPTLMQIADWYWHGRPLPHHLEDRVIAAAEPVHTSVSARPMADTRRVRLPSGAEVPAAPLIRLLEVLHTGADLPDVLRQGAADLLLILALSTRDRTDLQPRAEPARTAADVVDEVLVVRPAWAQAPV